ncbi:MAG: hypothetical protein BWZ02_03053 [Lentisphaerae bacterium ADurb.BinA184]|nr:MAG: hypothetical protein BWZ02_03053 [Lentisphaerae bacterium ADurb.BinA184]
MGHRRDLERGQRRSLDDARQLDQQPRAQRRRRQRHVRRRDHGQPHRHAGRAPNRGCRHVRRQQLLHTLRHQQHDRGQGWRGRDRRSGQRRAHDLLPHLPRRQSAGNRRQRPDSDHLRQHRPEHRRLLRDVPDAQLWLDHQGGIRHVGCHRRHLDRRPRQRVIRQSRILRERWHAQVVQRQPAGPERSDDCDRIRGHSAACRWLLWDVPHPLGRRHNQWQQQLQHGHLRHLCYKWYNQHGQRQHGLHRDVEGRRGHPDNQWWLHRRQQLRQHLGWIEPVRRHSHPQRRQRRAELFNRQLRASPPRRNAAAGQHRDEQQQSIGKCCLRAIRREGR